MPEAQGTQEPVYPQPRSFRLDDLSRSLLGQLATKLGVSQADIVRLAIRKFAVLEGVKTK
jgi:hypothetical protein